MDIMRIGMMPGIRFDLTTPRGLVCVVGVFPQAMASCRPAWSCVCRRLARCLHGLLMLWQALQAMLACALECDEDAIGIERLEMCNRKLLFGALSEEVSWCCFVLRLMRICALE